MIEMSEDQEKLVELKSVLDKAYELLDNERSMRKRLERSLEVVHAENKRLKRQLSKEASQ